MGCGSSSADVSKPGKKDTVFGVFEVKLIEAHIQHLTSSFSTMDPYVVVKFSNQTFKGEVVKKGGTNPQFKDKHTFFVNSFYKQLGRTLEVELMDSNIGSDDVIGYGIIDLDPYLNILQASSPNSEVKPANNKEQNKQGTLEKRESKSSSSPQKTTLRCFLNFDRKQAGVVTFEASFKEEATNIISFRFETAEFSRSTKTFGDMEPYVRVTAGEEVLQTKKSKDTATDKPVWKDEHLGFWCPKSLEKIKIEVMDQDKLIGECEMEKKDLLLDDSENEFAKEIVYEGKVAGKLWFNTKKNANPLFKELKGNYKKKQPQAEKKEEKKEQKKEQKKEEEKKEEKKEEEKKSEKKDGEENS